MTSASEAARERRAEGHAIHVVAFPRIKTHLGSPVSELADRIEEIEAEGWRFYQTSHTAVGDMLIFRRAD
jgi:hypothetical protein